MNTGKGEVGEEKMRRRFMVRVVSVLPFFLRQKQHDKDAFRDLKWAELTRQPPGTATP